MYRDSYSQPDSGLIRFLKALSASFRVGRFFGIELRVYWLTLVIMPIICISGFWGLPFTQVVALTVIVTGFLYLIIYSHEMSHIVAGWRFKMRTPLITLSPLGGVAHMSTPPPNPRAETIVAAAGPAVHLLWLAVVAPLHFWVFPSDSMWVYVGAGEWEVSYLRYTLAFLWEANLILMIFNLLPLFPMDGGRILRSILSNKMHPNKATIIAAKIGMYGAVVMAVVGLVLPGMRSGILFAIGLTNFFACRAEIRGAKHGASPYDATVQYEAWQSDPDAWKQGGDDGERKPGAIARWKQRRKEDTERREREDAASLEAEVDRVLERVSEVGMAGLTAKERSILERASKRRRR